MTAESVFGRRRERERLRAALAAAAGGEPGVIVVAGEAGIGKSTLVAALAADATGGPAASDSAATVLVGNCFSVAGEALPFAPIVQALRQLARSLSEPQRDRLAPHWPVGLARLVPLDEDRAGRAADPASPLSESGQSRLFEGLLSLLAELAADGPVILVVEDLHWADRSTLDLMSFLARNVSTEAVLVVLTVRSDDLSREHPLRAWLAELGRLPQVERLPLERLDRRGTAQQIEALLGAHPADDLVGMVHHHAAGNPLFTAEVLPWAQDPSRPLPETLHDLVEARLSALPAVTRRVLEVASVLGRTVALDVLAAVAQSSEADVEDALAMAVDRQLIEPRPGPEYGFRHPLYREVLESDLLPGDRRRLHRGAATVLEDQAADDPERAFALTAQIARHWQSADVADRGFRAAVRAGLAAAEVFAFAEADELLTRALDLSGSLPPEAFHHLPVDHAELLAHASQAAHLVGDGPRAVDLAGRAVQLCSEPVRRSRLLERQGTYCFNAGRADEADVAFRAALDLLPTDPATAARARVLAGLALLAMAWTRMDEARAWCGQALDVARAAGARPEEARALDALGVVTAYEGDFDAGVDFSRASLDIAREVGEPDELAGAYIDLAHVLGLAGRFDEAVEVCSTGLEQMRRVGLVRQDGTFLQANAAESLIKSGRWAEATELIDTALSQRPRGMRAFPILTFAARLSLGQGQLSTATARLDRAQSVADEHGLPDAWRRELYEVTAELALAEGRPDDALLAVESGLVLIEGGDEQRFAGPLVCLAARATADLVEQVRTERDPERLDQVRFRGDQAMGRASRFEPDPLDAENHPLPETRAVAVTAQAEQIRAGRQARGEAAADAWAVSADAWRRLGWRLPEVYASWREAEALVLAKHPGRRPVEAVRRAWTLANELGAQGVVGEIERLASWGRVDVGPLVSGEQQEESADSGPDLGLTARELEVLSALVAGSTNREIGTALFISVKTVSVHVSNILRKLGVANREEAARAAYRLGLVAGDS